MVQRSMSRLLTAFTVIGVAASCGGKPSDDKKVKEDAGTPPGPTVAPIAIPTVGVDAITRMNYPWNRATYKDYVKILAACCKGKKDWAAARPHAEAVLAKDPQNIGGHWLLGTAMSQVGEHAAAAEHIVAAIAADYGRYGANLAKEQDLAGFLATPHGTAVKELGAKIFDDYKKRFANALLVVGRRTEFTWPEKGGTSASSRGEVYAYDRDSRRFLRVTHTNETVVGFVKAPSTNEIAVLGFDRIDPKPPEGSDTPPTITRAFVFTVDLAEWKTSPRAVISKQAREVSVGWGTGDQLLVGVAPATGRSTVGPTTVSAVDRATGKLASVATPMPAPRIVFSLEEGRVVRVPDNVKATWSGEPATAPSLAVGERTIAIPESGTTLQSTIAVGPAYVAFATAVDPCSDKTSPSLYVADLKTGAPKHLLTAKSRFSTRWFGTNLLAYEDGDGAIRVWDAQTKRESFKLENKAGLALDVLSLSPAPMCKQAPPAAPEAGSGSDDLPPEDPGGPVTTPQ
jgi:hypothetical protein